MTMKHTHTRPVVSFKGTPWSAIHLEKLTVPQLVRQYPVCYKTRIFGTNVRDLRPDPTMILTDPANILTPYHFKTELIFCEPCKLRSTSLCNVMNSLITFPSLFNRNILPKYLFINIPKLPFPWCQRPGFTHTKTTDKISFLYFILYG